MILVSSLLCFWCILLQNEAQLILEAFVITVSSVFRVLLPCWVSMTLIALSSGIDNYFITFWSNCSKVECVNFVSLSPMLVSITTRASEISNGIVKGKIFSTIENKTKKWAPIDSLKFEFFDLWIVAHQILWVTVHPSNVFLYYNN